jgi:hypothetical protein
MQRPVVRRVQVRELAGGRDDERLDRSASGAGEHEPTSAGHGDRGLPHGDAWQRRDPRERLLLQLGRRIVGALLLRDPGCDRWSCACAGGQRPAEQGGPGGRAGHGFGAAVKERQSLGDPAADVGQGLAGDAVPAGVADGDGRGAGFAEQVLPGPVEELAGDHGVLLALRDGDRDPGEAGGRGGDAGVERQRAVQDRGAGVPGRVVEQQSAGERGAAAEPDQDDRPPGRRRLVEPAAEPVHRVAQRLRDGPADAAVGEPGVPAALGDRRSDRRVCRPGGEVLGEADDVALVAAPSVEQDDQRRRRVRRAGCGDDRVGEAGHAPVVSGTIWPAVRTPDHRSSSRCRSSASTGAVFSYSPHACRGSIHMTSNSLPSGSAP